MALALHNLCYGNYFKKVAKKSSSTNKFYYLDSDAKWDRFLLLTWRQQTMKFLAPEVQGKNDGNFCGVFMLQSIIDDKISKTRSNNERIFDKLGQRTIEMQEENSFTPRQFCRAQPATKPIKNIKIAFFPPSLTRFLQPMDRGIILIPSRS